MPQPVESNRMDRMYGYCDDGDRFDFDEIDADEVLI